MPASAACLGKESYLPCSSPRVTHRTGSTKTRDFGYQLLLICSGLSARQNLVPKTRSGNQSTHYPLFIAFWYPEPSSLTSEPDGLRLANCFAQAELPALEVESRFSLLTTLS